MNPLETIIAEIIAAEGPMALDRYMGLCLGHPQHGYYMSRDPFGEAGDFITAPEISQVFGELIGIWCVAAWDAMGRPQPFNLVELGPGRGTLMADILRASKVMAGFREAAEVHLVEMSPVLCEIQQERLGSRVSWHSSLEAVPAAPAIFIANEFFDAIPIRQFEKHDGTWYERCVGAKGFGFMPAALDNTEGTDGDVIEFAPQRNYIAHTLGERLAVHAGAALIIDYGHLQSAPGDTLQAVRAHQSVSILDGPGESDMTSHVDFEALAKAITAGGGRTHAPITQRDFLLAMGIAQRAEVLASRADVGAAEILGRAVQRLTGEAEMGKLFKVMAATSPPLTTPYPFGLPHEAI